MLSLPLFLALPVFLLAQSISDETFPSSVQTVEDSHGGSNNTSSPEDDTYLTIPSYRYYGAGAP